MTNQNKIYIGLAAFLGVFLFALGRYTTPVKTITVTKTVEVEKKTDDKATDKKDDKTIVIVEVKKPDGTDTKTTTITDNKDNKSTDKSTDSTSISIDKSKEVVKSNDKLTVSILAGAVSNWSGLSSPTYGLMLSKPILGPIDIGTFAMTNKVLGFSLGVTF